MIKFYTNGFKHEDVEFIKDKLCDVYSVRGFVSLKEKKYPVLNFTAHNALTILDIVRPYVTESFSYKTRNLYVNKNCVTCQKSLSRNNAKHCETCLVFYHKSRNQSRYKQVDVASNTISLMAHMNCLVCGEPYDDRIGSKFCFSCRPTVRRAYKNVTRLSKNPNFSFIEYVRARVTQHV
jgi:hypothetical protein